MPCVYLPTVGVSHGHVGACKHRWLEGKMRKKKRLNVANVSSPVTSREGAQTI